MTLNGTLKSKPVPETKIAPRGGFCSISPVRATGPAAGAADSFLELRAHSCDVLFSGLQFLDGNGPANPFIARQGCDVFPFCPRRFVGRERPPQIRWHLVYRAIGD